MASHAGPCAGRTEVSLLTMPSPSGEAVTESLKGFATKVICRPVLRFVTCRVCESPCTAIGTFAGAVTVKVVDASLSLWLPLIVVVPAVMPVAMPTLFIVATAVLVDVHDVLAGDSWLVEPSINVSTRVNCCVLPTAIVGFAGVSLTDETSKLPNAEPQPGNPRSEIRGRM